MVILAGDASWGPYASEPSLRHIGCGVAQMGQDGQHRGAIACTFAECEPQEVDLGELDALLVALQWAPTCNVIFLADSEGSCWRMADTKGVEGQHANRNGANCKVAEVA